MDTQLGLIRTGVMGATRTACLAGFPVAVTLAIMTSLALFLGVSTPVRSGPYCAGLCVNYPYSEAAQFFPRDYLWMMAALFIAPLFTLLTGCIHFCVPIHAKPFSLLALSFAAISTAVLVPNYLAQFLVVQVSLSSRQMDGIALLTQYNPNGLFIGLEDAGYLLMAMAFLPLALAIPSSIRPGGALRWTFGAAFGLSVLAFVGLALRFGPEMSLPFELAIILVVWIGLVIAGILSSIFFRRAEKASIAD